MNKKTNVIFDSHTQIKLIFMKEEDIETVNDCYNLRPKIKT